MIHAGVEVQILDRLDDLPRLEAAWREVQDACEHKHVCLDQRFIAAWWRHAGHGKSMHTLALRRGNAVVGIVPLALSRGWEAFPTSEKNVRIADDFQYLPSLRWRRVVPIRRLSFPLSFPSTNLRAHFLLRQADTSQIEAVLDYCRSIRDRWDVLAFDGIPSGSTQEAMLCDAAGDFGLRRGKSRRERTLLRATLPDSMDAFLSERSRNFRSSYRRALRQSIERTSGLGQFQIREFRRDSIDQGMERLLALERRSWKAASTRKRTLHVTLNDSYRRFHRDVARAFAASDQAQVLVTEIGGHSINALYSLEREGVVACVLSFQAEDTAQQVSLAPLWGTFFEGAIARGSRVVHFNGNSDHLARMANGQDTFSRVVFYHQGIYSSFLRRMADTAHAVARVARRGSDHDGRLPTTSAASVPSVANVSARTSSGSNRIP